jgi:hypothetical protein
MEVDEIHSGSFTVAGFGISNAEPSRSSQVLDFTLQDKLHKP